MNIVNVEAYTLGQVKQQVSNVKIEKNATQAWKKAGMPEGDELIAFCDEYAAKNKKMQAFYIVIEAGNPDTTAFPFEIDNIKQEGSRKFKTKFEIVTADGKILASAPSKSEALKAAKKLCVDMREELGADTHKCRVIQESEELAFTFSYKPGINTKLGKFIVFYN